MTRIINADGSLITDEEARVITEALYEVAERLGWTMVVTRDPFGNMEFTTDYGEESD
jgi:hypothetical protein